MIYNKAEFGGLYLKGEVIRVLRHIPATKQFAKTRPYGKNPILPTDEGRDYLKLLIKNGKPFMAGRFGTTEGAALYCYWKSKVLGGTIPLQRLDTMCTNAGFFPKDMALLERWAELESEACRSVDILGVMNFVGEEWIVRHLCANPVLMPSGGLSSAKYGWTSVLKDLKVLVVHPFAETIRLQYENHRKDIFPDSDSLPQFDLRCIKAVQTIADAKDDRFNTWFDAIDYMTDEAQKTDFDIALIGCGAYGFQLAHRIKTMGRQAVHMGGCLQTLFGIKGKRWDQLYRQMYNEAWVYPSDDEMPQGYEKVEGGCYWK